MPEDWILAKAMWLEFQAIVDTSAGSLIVHARALGEIPRHQREPNTIRLSRQLPCAVQTSRQLRARQCVAAA